MASKQKQLFAVVSFSGVDKILNIDEIKHQIVVDHKTTTEMSTSYCFYRIWLLDKTSDLLFYFIILIGR